MSSITALFERYPIDCRPTRIESLDTAGGMSGAKFWRIHAPRGVLALRRWPAEHPTPDRLRFIHAVIQQAGRTLDFLPVPITTRDGHTFISDDGHLWELAPWMPGTADYAASPNAKKLTSAMSALARFHLAVSDFHKASLPEFETGSSAIVSRIERLQELAHGGVQQLAQAVTNSVWPEFAPLAREFLAVLPAALPVAISQNAPLADLRFSLQPCIRDIWSDNVLFTRDEVTGVVDFGAMEIDTPAVDVARLLGSLAGPDPTSRQTGIAAYERVRPLSTNELRAVAALDTTIVLLAGCNWVRWIYVERRQFDNPAQICQHFRRIVERTRLIVAAPGQ
jgi:homoserine kinase type II